MNRPRNRRSVRRFTAAGALAAVAAPALAVLAANPAAAATTCTYNVSGKVVTTDNRLNFHDTFSVSDSTDALAADTPLAGAKVRVSTSWSGLGVFDVWSEKTLGSDGSFSFSKTWTGAFDCSFKRDYKVDVSFEDSELEIGTSPWYTVKQDSGSARSAGTHNLGTLRFKDGAAKDAGDDDARIAAETWVVVHRAIDLLQSEGVGYTSKITVHNPNRTVTSWMPDGMEGSYADPGGSMTAYIDDDASQKVGTILHEIGHLWAYQHSTGEECLTDAWWADLSTHDATETSCVAFHEGFAAYFGDMLSWELDQADLLNGSAEYPAAFNREGISNLSDYFSGADFADIDNLSGVQTSEFGWMHAFRVLDQKQLGAAVFSTLDVAIDIDGDGSADPFVGSATGTGTGTGTIALPAGTVISGSTCDRAPNLDLFDVLNVFGSSFNSSSPTVESLLSRADSRLTDFDATDASNYKTLIDPAKSSEPSSMYC